MSIAKQGKKLKVLSIRIVNFILRCWPLKKGHLMANASLESTTLILDIGCRIEGDWRLPSSKVKTESVFFYASGLDTTVNPVGMH